MTTEQVIECTQACTITVQHEFALPVAQITVSEGVQISGAIIGVWVIAWAVRVLISTIRGASAPQQEE